MPVICGPTAGGKSSLAYGLVRELHARAGLQAEVISADAYQIYRGMDIGTAKPTKAEQQAVRHHLIDLVEPGETFTVNDWLAHAERAMQEIRARGALPIVVGGTHLYIKALLEGLFEGPEPDEALRARLLAKPSYERRAELERVDPQAALRIHPNDERRTLRALEIFHQTGLPISELQKQWDAGRTRHDLLLVGLDWPAETINPRINARVRAMMAGDGEGQDARPGLLEETKALQARGVFSAPIGTGRGNQAAEALGYKQLLDYLRGVDTLDQAVEQIKIETRRFAKNQRTWLKRLRTTPGSVWIEASATPVEAWPALVMQALLPSPK